MIPVPAASSPAYEAGDVAAAEVDVQPFLEFADRAHRAVSLE